MSLGIRPEWYADSADVDMCILRRNDEQAGLGGTLRTVISYSRRRRCLI